MPLLFFKYRMVVIVWAYVYKNNCRCISSWSVGGVSNINISMDDNAESKSTLSLATHRLISSLTFLNVRIDDVHLVLTKWSILLAV